MKIQSNYLYYSFRIVLVVTDFILINLTFWLAFLLADQLTVLSDVLYRHYLLIFNMTWLLCANFFRLYSKENIQRSELIYRSTWKSVIAQALLFTFYLIFTKDISISRLFLLVLNGLLGIGFLLSRFMGTAVEVVLKKRLSSQKPVAVLGNNKTGMLLASFFQAKETDFVFKGFLNKNNDTYMDENGNILPEINKAIGEAVQKGINEIYVPFTMGFVEAGQLLREAEKQCVRLKFVPVGTDRSIYSYLKVDYMEKFPVISMRKEPMEDINNRFRKRFFDLLFSILVIVLVLSWLYPILALIIKLQSPGPVLFKQLRSGRDNKSFVCYKFRTMRLNEESDTLQATAGDKRITYIGRILRKTSLDELPQFFNVFKGEMSVVGPRPHMLMHTKQYSKLINRFMIRHFMKPGITGWAQVHGFRGETKNPRQMSRRVEYDIWYLGNWSVMLDVKIIFLTIINVFRGDKNAH